MSVTLTLAEVLVHPEVATYTMIAPVASSVAGIVLLRPLRHDDVEALADFLAGLSPPTRRYSIFPSYDMTTAQALCEAIARYDKLRFVVELPAIPSAPATIIGLFEFSFDIPDGDLRRYARYGVQLDGRNDCRFGPTLADAYQNHGLASHLFPAVLDVARNFGKSRIILWGGVLADNARAIRFYEKQGFQQVGVFEDDSGELLIDMILALEKTRS